LQIYIAPLQYALLKGVLTGEYKNTIESISNILQSGSRHEMLDQLQLLCCTVEV